MTRRRKKKKEEEEKKKKVVKVMTKSKVGHGPLTNNVIQAIKEED